MKQSASIPVHKLNDRHSAGIYVRHINRRIAEQEEDISRAHRDDHYLFFFQQEGYSRFMIDFEEREIKGAAIFCILPGQVHYSKAYQAVSGFFFAIDTLMVDEPYRHFFEQELLSIYPVVPDAATADHLERCLTSLMCLVQDPATTVNRSVFQSLAAAAIGIIADAYMRSADHVQRSGARSSSITRSFKALLKQEYRTMKSPAEYASRLNISTAYLNECVKMHTGRAVSNLIHHEITLEARRLLCYSSQTIKEIAYELGFSDPAYFSRLFTRTAGMAPGQFRKTYHE